MQKISILEAKIFKLKDQKKRLQIKRAVFLEGHLQKILKKEYSDLLVRGLAHWAASELKSNPQRKESGEQAPPASFCEPPSCSSEKNPAVPSKDHLHGG